MKGTVRFIHEQLNFVYLLELLVSCDKVYREYRVQEERLASQDLKAQLVSLVQMEIEEVLVTLAVLEWLGYLDRLVTMVSLAFQDL